MLTELFDRESAGGNGNARRAECLGAGDVFRSVTDDDDLVRLKGPTRVSGRARHGDRAEFVPICEITAVAAEGEMAIEPEVPHLRRRAARNVSGQQPNMNVRILLLALQQGDGSRQNLSRKSSVGEIPFQTLQIG